MPHMLKLPKSLLRLVGCAIADYGMIRNNDRVLLGLSGGKDSLTLLHLLRHFQRHAPIRFALAAVTVDPQADGFDPSPLKSYLAGLEVPLFYRSEPILDLAVAHMDNASYCSFCARLKRGVMYATARAQGYNVLALAQHLDDLAESFFMSLFNGGRLNTMKAHYRIDAGDLRVIRPLIYVRERQTAQFVKATALPLVTETCPGCMAKPTERARMKALLAMEEQRNPRVFKSLLSAMRPLMAQGLSKAQSTDSQDDNGQSLPVDPQ